MAKIHRSRKRQYNKFPKVRKRSSKRRQRKVQKRTNKKRGGGNLPDHILNALKNPGHEIDINALRPLLVEPTTITDFIANNSKWKIYSDNIKKTSCSLVYNKTQKLHLKGSGIGGDVYLHVKQNSTDNSCNKDWEENTIIKLGKYTEPGDNVSKSEQELVREGLIHLYIQKLEGANNNIIPFKGLVNIKWKKLGAQYLCFGKKETETSRSKITDKHDTSGKKCVNKKLSEIGIILQPLDTSLENFLEKWSIMKLKMPGNLSKNIDKTKKFISGSSWESFNTQFINIISGLVKGFKFLSQNNIIHGDIAPRNILLRLEFTPYALAGDITPYIIDFGYTMILGDGSESPVLANLKLPVKTLSPSSLTKGKLTIGDNIYGLGGIIYSMLGFQSSAFHLLNVQQYIDIVNSQNDNNFLKHYLREYYLKTDEKDRETLYCPTTNSREFLTFLAKFFDTKYVNNPTKGISDEFWGDITTNIKNFKDQIYTGNDGNIIKNEDIKEVIKEVTGEKVIEDVVYPIVSNA